MDRFAILKLNRVMLKLCVNVVCGIRKGVIYKMEILKIFRVCQQWRNVNAPWRLIRNRFYL